MRMTHKQLHSIQGSSGRLEHVRGDALVVHVHHNRVGRHAALDLPPKVDLFRFRSVTVAFHHLGRLSGPQNQARLAAILGATNAPPIGTAILAKQIIIDDDQWTAALAVDELVVWQAKGKRGEKTVGKS